MKKFLLLISLWISATMLFAQSSATLRVGSTDVTGLNPGDKVYVPVYCDAISANLIIGFQFFVAFDHTVLAWDGTSTNPLPGLQGIHPNFPYNPSDWLFNDNGAEMVALWIDPDYSGEIINPGETFFTYVFTYLGGETELTWGLSENIGSYNESSKGSTEMYDESFGYFSLTLVNGSVSFPSFDVTFHVTSGGSDLEDALVTVGTESIATDASGIAMFDLPNGTYNYTITKAGYSDKTGSFTVNNAPVTLNVVMYLEGTEWVVTFHVTSGGNDLQGAVVTVGSESVTTDNSGMAILNLSDGDYNYTVSKYGYADATGSFTVAGVTQTVSVDMTMLTHYNVTFHVTSGVNNVDGASVEIVGIETKITDVNGEAVFSLIDGDYNYIASKLGYISNSGAVTVAGSDILVDVDLIAVYDITFHVTSDGNNLVSAAVTVDGITKYTNSNGIATFTLPDGDYNYLVTYPQYFDATGSITVAGAPATIEVVMNPIVWDVTFHVTADGGDLEGALIDVDGNQLITGPDGTAVFTLVDGDYVYLVTKDGYIPVEGAFTVSGAAIPIEITMVVSTSVVTFHVTSGGANIQNAAVTVGSTTIQTNFSGLATFNLSDGDYTYTVSKAGYEIASGDFVVSGANFTIEVELIPILYDVTFHVTSGGVNLADADVTVNGITVPTDALGIAMFGLINGSYPYTVTKDGYTTVTGTILVNNAPLTQEVVMSLTPWQITIHVEDPLGTNISGAVVTISGVQVTTGSNGNAIFNLVNGNYNYEIVKTGYVTANGSFTVNGANQTIDVVLVPVLYPITFHVTSGGSPLPDANVTVAGTTLTTNSNGDVVFNLQNNTYIYSVAKTGYITANGTVIVNNGPQTINVDLVEVTYAITFVVTSSGGPVQGASVTVDGTTLVTPANGTVVFNLSNGTYPWTITHPLYIDQTGSVVVNNAAQTVPVVLITGINDLTLDMFNVYPNPSTGVFYINAAELAQYESVVTVYNLAGDVVTKVEFKGNETNRIDLTEQQAGTYMLQIILDGKVINKTVIIL